MKSNKANRFSHTSNKKMGVGEHMGTAIRNKVGKVLEGYKIKEANKKDITKPKTLA